MSRPRLDLINLLIVSSLERANAPCEEGFCCGGLLAVHSTDGPDCLFGTTAVGHDRKARTATTNGRSGTEIGHSQPRAPSAPLRRNWSSARYAIGPLVRLKRAISELVGGYAKRVYAGGTPSDTAVASAETGSDSVGAVGRVTCRRGCSAAGPVPKFALGFSNRWINSGRKPSPRCAAMACREARSVIIDRTPSAISRLTHPGLRRRLKGGTPFLGLNRVCLPHVGNGASLCGNKARFAALADSAWGEVALES